MSPDDFQFVLDLLPGSPARKKHTAAPSPRRAAAATTKTRAPLDLKWSSLADLRTLASGFRCVLSTASMNGRAVVVKHLSNDCRTDPLSQAELESELSIHSALEHPNIVTLLGAGRDERIGLFLVLERLDGGTLTQHVTGHDRMLKKKQSPKSSSNMADTPIARFFSGKKKGSTTTMPFSELLDYAQSLAYALAYLHGRSAVPGCVVLHRDLKPDNIVFTLSVPRTLKLIDFGLAKAVPGADASLNDLYEMSGETGSLRYMAPEVAERMPYNHKADVYSFGIILWEMTASKRPFEGYNRDIFFKRVVRGGERPDLHYRWPRELKDLLASCWATSPAERPNFNEVLVKLKKMQEDEQQRASSSSKSKSKDTFFGAVMERHSMWF